jgi:hypothetical protein
MWCWRKIEKIRWTGRVRNEEVLHRVKEEGNVVHTVKGRKANWIGHILRRNCLLKHVIEEKIQGITKRGRKRKQLLDDLKEKRIYWNLKEKALDRTLWITRFRSVYEPVARQGMQCVSFEGEACGLYGLLNGCATWSDYVVSNGRMVCEHCGKCPESETHVTRSRNHGNQWNISKDKVLPRTSHEGPEGE